MSKSKQTYPTDRNDNEWQVIAPYLPVASPTGRPRKHEWRRLLNAIFYIVRGGCAWRMLPVNFPPWQTVYHYFCQWRRDGTWERLNAALRQALREKVG
jgi:putative transposase